MIRLSISCPVSDPSGIAHARRTAQQCADMLKLNETTAGKATLVATELATNLIKHAQQGTLLFGSDDETPRSLAIVSIDKGRGIENVQRALEDGYSTAGSQGTGLGAIARAASVFDVYSMPGKGTAVLCWLDEEHAHRSTPQALRRPPMVKLAGVCIPYPGETVAGDSWTAVREGDVVTIAVADGLGHGHAAAAASTAAVAVVRERSGVVALDQLMHETHGALRSTRGAAVAFARIQPLAAKVDFVGVGNISMSIHADGAVRKGVSHNGTVGAEMRKVQLFSYPWRTDGLLVMASDGIASAWSIAGYPGLMDREAAIIAAVVYRDFCRGNDDATVVVAKAA